MSTQEQEFEKLYRNFLIALVNNEYDLTRLLKASFRINKLKITPVFIEELRDGRNDEKVADALFLIIAGKYRKLVKGEVHVDAFGGYIHIYIFDTYFEVDSEKLK